MVDFSSIYQMANKPTVGLEQPIDAMGRALQLQHLSQQNQIGTQQVQQAGMTTQEQQLQLQSQMALRKAMSDPSIDFTKPNALSQVISKAAATGASPKDLMALQNSNMEYQKNFATLDKTTQETRIAAKDQIRGQLTALGQSPTYGDQDSQQQWAQIVSQAQAKGLIQPGQVPAQLPPDKAALTPLVNSLALGSTLAKETYEATIAGARQTSAEAAGKAPHAGIGPDGKPGFFQLDENNQIPAGWKPQPPASLALNLPQGVSPAAQRGETGPAVLASLPPATAGVVKAILDGRQSPPSGFAQKTPYWQGIMQNVYAADPEWSEQRSQVRKSFTTGTDGRNIGNLNTALTHYDAYLEAAQGLKNGTFVPGNDLYNRVQAALGHAAPTTLQGIADALAGETASALKGNATDIEIAKAEQRLKTAQSPEQFINNGKANMGILRDKLGTYQERYQQQIPGDTNWSPILPTARGVLQKYGITSGHAGETPQANSAPKGAASVDDLLKALGY